MIYVTRALTGDVQGLIDGVREACAARGFDVFLAGDEFFFFSAPSAQKIARWDGIFGYNDRAVRRTCASNPALSRRVTADGDPGSHFRAVFRDTALAHVDAELPLACITSFNEWHEDTQVERTAGTGASTAMDTSASGDAYTQGFVHDDYGLNDIEIIRDATLAFTGRALGPDGPLAGATIEVLDGAAVVLPRESFSTGAYTVPRLRFAVGRAYTPRESLTGSREATSTSVMVLPERTQTGVDFTLAEVP
jgi:hypothetical protein